ncbi:type VII secretion target [Actinoplanes sp. TRM 88003]|uniref:Type VII secretion target n=1 Tax=Paractinoplanes aksuensis TaxID=2939490 RepID=A0ABT1DY26_9ACTN|nr:type VII secretion target [Actinoplanes aksuensis]MCO8275749.1 type VII secretion target [Actinoplanes aksuensis]
MNPELEVDLEALRRAAAGLATTGDRVTAATAAEPATPAVPRWGAADAAQQAAEAARGQLALLGAEVAETARRLAESAAAYERADDRAASRLRLAR